MSAITARTSTPTITPATTTPGAGPEDLALFWGEDVEVVVELVAEVTSVVVIVGCEVVDICVSLATVAEEVVSTVDDMGLVVLAGAEV